MNSTKQRNLDFMESYEETLRTLPHGHRLSRQKILEHVIANGAPRYYISFSTAYRALRAFRRGRLPPGNKLKRLMWEELAHKTDSCKLSLGIRSDSQALSIVLSRSHASRYFITPGYAIKLLQHLNYDKLHQKPTSIRSRRNTRLIDRLHCATPCDARSQNTQHTR